MIFGDLVCLKLSDICLTGEEKPRKTSSREFVPTGDRTRARCVPSTHATACLTAVDYFFNDDINIIMQKFNTGIFSFIM